MQYKFSVGSIIQPRTKKSVVLVVDKSESCYTIVILWSNNGAHCTGRINKHSRAWLEKCFVCINSKWVT